MPPQRIPSYRHIEGPKERTFSFFDFLMKKGKFPDAGGQFTHAPYFNFNDGHVKFNTNWVDNANDNYGSASGFLPLCLSPSPQPSPVQGEGGYFMVRLLSSRLSFYQFP